MSHRVFGVRSRSGRVRRTDRAVADRHDAVALARTRTAPAAGSADAVPSRCTAGLMRASRSSSSSLGMVMLDVPMCRTSPRSTSSLHLPPGLHEVLVDVGLGVRAARRHVAARAGGSSGTASAPGTGRGSPAAGPPATCWQDGMTSPSPCLSFHSLEVIQSSSRRIAVARDASAAHRRSALRCRRPRRNRSAGSRRRRPRARPPPPRSRRHGRNRTCPGRWPAFARRCTVCVAARGPGPCRRKCPFRP